MCKSIDYVPSFHLNEVSMKTQHATGIKELCPAPEDLLKQMYLAAVFNSIILNKYFNLSQ